MPTITSIQPQKKRSGYYNIFVDEDYFCSLSDLQLSTLKLKIGQEASLKELNNIKNNSELSKVYDRALYYLQYGPRTVMQMHKYLMQKGFLKEHVDIAIDKLQSMNYLNDLDYSLSFISTRQKLKPRSVAVLKKELLLRGVNKETMELAIAQSEDVDNELAIKTIIEKKIKQKKYQDKNKMLQYLSQQGFGYSESKESIEKINFWQ